MSYAYQVVTVEMTNQPRGSEDLFVLCRGQEMQSSWTVCSSSVQVIVGRWLILVVFLNRGRVSNGGKSSDELMTVMRGRAVS